MSSNIQIAVDLPSTSNASSVGDLSAKQLLGESITTEQGPLPYATQLSRKQKADRYLKLEKNERSYYKQCSLTEEGKGAFLTLSAEERRVYLYWVRTDQKTSLEKSVEMLAAAPNSKDRAILVTRGQKDKEADDQMKKMMNQPSAAQLTRDEEKKKLADEALAKKKKAEKPKIIFTTRDQYVKKKHNEDRMMQNVCFDMRRRLDLYNTNSEHSPDRKTPSKPLSKPIRFRGGEWSSFFLSCGRDVVGVQ